MKTIKQFLLDRPEPISLEKFEQMDAEQKAALYNELSAYNETAFEALKKEGADLKDALETMQKENTAANNVMLAAIKKQGQVIAELQRKGAGQKEAEKTELVKFIEKNAEDFKTPESEAGKGMRKVGLKAMSLVKAVFKAPALMTTANVIPNVVGGFNQLFGNYIDTTIHETPKPDNYILPLVNVTTQPGTESIWYVERENEEGNAQFIGEGDLKPLADGEWIQKKADIKEVAVRWKMSNRLIMHASAVVQNFRRHAGELMEQVIDDGVATGDGVGNNLSGVSTLAAPFVVPPALANFYPSANIFDVIMAVATYVRLNNFKGQLTCILNTAYMAQMRGIKAGDFQYILPPFVSADGTQVGEVRVIFTNKLPDTDIILGDLKRFNVVVAENIAYYEGWENDDFSKNLSSRKLEAFMGTYLPDSDAGSIIYDQIATILTAIEV